MFFNGWNIQNKRWDRFNIKIRVAVITLFEFYYDYGKRHVRVILFNLGWKNNSGWKKQ